MTRPTAAAARQYLGYAADSSQHWRLDVIALRKLIDSERSTAPRFRRLVDVLASRLLRAMSRHDAAMVPSVRELRRINRSHEALAVAETVWETRAQDSAGWALACAMTFYDNQTLWLGDIALAHAMTLEPRWVELYKEQARNRRWRGNTASAIEGAAYVIELTHDPTEVRLWNEFIGTELHRSGQFGEALLHLERGEPDEPTWEYWYRRGVCHQKAGDSDHAQHCYSRAGETGARTGAAGLGEVPPALRTAMMHYRQEALHESLGELRSLRVSGRENEMARAILLGRTHCRLEQPSLAVVDLKDSDLGAESEDVAAIIALAQELDDQPARAADEYRLMLAQHPNSSYPVRQRLARALSSAGLHEESVQTWQEIPSDLRRLTPEVAPSFREDSELARALIASKSWTEATPLLQRLAAASSSETNAQKLHHAAGLALANIGELERAERHFTLSSPAKVAHPSEAERSYHPLGPHERYTEARESVALDHGIVLFESFNGAKTGCNPLAISQRLLVERPDLRQVWAITKDATIHASLLGHPLVSFVEHDSYGYRQHLATAGTLVNNATFPRPFATREGQRYLNTWHGVPWKSMGRDIADDPFAYDNVARNLLQATHLALPDAHTRDVLITRHDVEKLVTARISITGQPRMDLTIGMGAEEGRDLRRRLGVPHAQKVVFYAPTWRGKLATGDTSFELYLRAISTMARVTDAHVLVRVHYYVRARLDPKDLPTNVTVVPEDIDTNEVLAISDVLVSDFSSVVFDFAALHRPIIRYLTDLERYATERGLYFDVSDIPGVTATDEAELYASTTSAVRGDLATDWSSSPVASAWQHEDGRSTERAMALLFDDEDEDPDDSPDASPAILISMGSLNPNGMTRSLRNLIAADPAIAEATQLTIPRGALENRYNWDVARELHEAIGFSMTSHAAAATRRENLAWKRLQISDDPLTEELLDVLRSRVRRERLRNLGRVHFAAVVDFDGYGLYQSALLALGFDASTRTVSILHNEFAREVRTRFPHLRSVARILAQFDSLPSVISSVRDVNREALANDHGVPEELHTVLPNTINLAQIRQLADQEPDADLHDWLQRPGPHVVLVGRLSVEKNHITLFQALARLLQEGGSAPRLVLLGDGPSRPELQRRVNDLGLSDQVLFAGQRTNPYSVMKRADALVLPSLHEGQPLVLLEAMTLNTPVVATTIPGPTALLRDGALGMLVSPDVEGLEKALRTIMHSELPLAEAFDPESYQRDAVDAFWAQVT